MRFIAAGLVLFAGAIVIGLAYHDKLKEGWQAISSPLPKATPAKGPGKQ